MAGKSITAYWFKKDKRDELLKGNKVYIIADIIGIDKHFLSNIINQNMPVKHKAIAYAITKCANSDYEIEDIFIKKDIQ